MNDIYVHNRGGDKMKSFEVFNAFDEFLKDPNLSLRAKGFLTMVLTDNITTGYEIEKYCTDSHEDIQDTLLELRINHYIRYNPIIIFRTLPFSFFHRILFC